MIVALSGSPAWSRIIAGDQAEGRNAQDGRADRLGRGR